MKTRECYETHTACNGPECNQSPAVAETAHTPTPWQVVIEPQVAFETDYPHPLGLRPQTRIFISSDGMTIAELPNDIPGQRWNAAHIVACVNSHDGLVSALKRAEMALRSLMPPNRAVLDRIAQETIAQAEQTLATIGA